MPAIPTVPVLAITMLSSTSSKARSSTVNCWVLTGTERVWIKGLAFVATEPKAVAATISVTTGAKVAE